MAFRFRYQERRCVCWRNCSGCSSVASVVGNGDGLETNTYEKDAALLKSSDVGCGDGSMR